MHAVVLAARNADAGAVNLGQAIDVENLNAELVFDAVTHLFAPTLRANNALAQVELIAQASLRDFLSEQKRIATRARDNRAVQVLHHLQLLLGIARTHGNSHSAQALAAKLEPNARSPQTIARGNLNAILIGNARRAIATREHFGPIGNILCGVRNNDRRARRARRAVDAHNFLVGYGLNSQRIGFA